jgi:parallel beta-helix repeat protein
MPTPRPHTPIRILVVAAALLTSAVAGSQAATAMAELGSPSCNLYASASGSDEAPGSLERPFASVQHLADSLQPGQSGCVRGGMFKEDVTIEHGGSSDAPVTISSYPGERATLVGRLWVDQGADHVTVENLNLNGRNSASLPSPTVNGNFAIFLGNDVTDEHTEICFVVGSSWGRANHTLIQGNRIHDCGMIPSRNQDHGIYVDEADNTEILDNVIYDNTDRGIQLYPDAQGTLIERNIIDSNGEGILFGGSSGTASSGAVVQDNLMTNAQTRYDVESWYPSGNPSGQDNVVQSNCVWGGAEGTVEASKLGFQAAGNMTANPAYANPSQGDYRVNASSPCAQLLAPNTIPTEPFGTPSTTTYPGAPAPAEVTLSKHRDVRAKAAASHKKKKARRSKRHKHHHRSRSARHHHRSRSARHHHRSHSTKHHRKPSRDRSRAAHRRHVSRSGRTRS